MKAAEIECKISGRVKHLFSIYKKMVNQNKTLDQVYDVFAVRVIVDSVKDCYAVLGLIHEAYKPIPGRFKDYISTPKPNMYRSLHTTVIGRDGIPFEVQIRTWEMHQIAEYGICAHWKYKTGEKSKEEIDEKLLEQTLYTANQPPVDLVLRPSGEYRLSNFLIWQSAYAEFVFMDVLWPDFKEEDLDRAFEEYARRDRRFGGV